MFLNTFWSDPSGHSLFEIWADTDLLLDALANGEINQIEHYKCVMGPGGTSIIWTKTVRYSFDIRFFSIEHVFSEIHLQILDHYMLLKYLFC